ncbi:MAG: photosystem II protein Y [Synechococcales cyanobacterium M58_A2018_015]|nr:photosystem II protein Y [Synechococcales cyanobacterium M58_A2018_015]
MFDLSHFIDLRWLVVFSPITTAIAWAMVISEDSRQDFWWF